MLSVTGFSLCIDGVALPAGAVKNEYVFSLRKSEAIKTAARRIIVNLEANKGVQDWDPKNLQFEVDEVDASWNVFLLFRRDGYVFFKNDSNFPSPPGAANSIKKPDS
jgi:hypothetical protein